MTTSPRRLSREFRLLLSRHDGGGPAGLPRGYEPPPVGRAGRAIPVG